MLRNMKEYFKGMSIKKKFTFSFSVLIIGVFTIQGIIYSGYIANTAENKARSYVLETLRQTEGKVDTYLSTIELITKNIISNSVIRENLTKIDYDEAVKVGPSNISYEDIVSVTSELSKITLVYDNINSIQIYTPEYTINYNFISKIGDYNTIDKMDSFRGLKESNGEIFWISTHEDFSDMYSNEKIFAFSAARKFISVKDGKELGYVFVNINEIALSNIIKDIRIGKSGQVVIFDNNGQIISSAKQNMIGKKIDSKMVEKISLLGNEGYFFTDTHKNNLIIFTKSDKTSWGVMTEIPVSELAGELEELQLINIYLITFGVLVSIIVVYMISKEITRPLGILTDSMQKVQKGDLTTTINIKNNDEFGQLGHSFNTMTKELRELIKRVYEVEISEKEAELKALQAQVNPHFLYNTLDAIYWMLIMKGEEKVSELVVLLSDILRYSISQNENIVKTHEDIKQVKNYLALQKARFMEKLEWHIDIQEEILNINIPKMIIQPIIENAINHGMDSRKGKLTIGINGMIEDSSVVFIINDDGIGISEELIPLILQKEYDKLQRKSNHTGLGLSGVNERIRLLYGENSGISISSKLGCGTSVKIKLPINVGMSKEAEDEDCTC